MHLHQKRDRLLERRNCLLGFLTGPDVLHTLWTIPIPRLDFTCVNNKQTAHKTLPNVSPPVESVVLVSTIESEARSVSIPAEARADSSPRWMCIMKYSPGSWNITTTSSLDTCTSVEELRRCSRVQRWRAQCHHTAFDSLGTITHGSFEAGQRVLGKA